MMTAKEIIKKLKESGWYTLPQDGTSHIHLKHPEKKGKVTVPNHKDVAMGTVKSIEKQADIKLR